MTRLSTHEFIHRRPEVRRVRAVADDALQRETDNRIATNLQLAASLLRHERNRITILSLNAVRDREGKVRITIQDNGCRLPPGFAMATVEKPGGHVCAVPGKGACFEISIPARHQARNAGRVSRGVRS